MDERLRLVTASEAEQLTGVPAGTIRSAAARDVPGQPGVKQLAQWGLAADGQTKLYRLCDIQELAASTRRRRRSAAAGGVS